MKTIITTLFIVAIFGQGCTRCYDCQYPSGNVEEICKGDSRFDVIKRGGTITDYNGAEATKCVPK